MLIKMLKSIDGAVDGFTLMKFEAGKHYDLAAMGAASNCMERALDLGANLVRAGLAVESKPEQLEADAKAEEQAAADAAAKKQADAEAKKKASESRKLAEAQALIEKAKKKPSAPAAKPAPIPEPAPTPPAKP
jgi:colicin import membrane protein